MGEIKGKNQGKIDQHILHSHLKRTRSAQIVASTLSPKNGYNHEKKGSWDH